jgi:hypothetical protein
MSPKMSTKTSKSTASSITNFGSTRCIPPTVELSVGSRVKLGASVLAREESAGMESDEHCFHGHQGFRAERGQWQAGGQSI